jgi:hypothetical protein
MLRRPGRGLGNRRGDRGRATLRQNHSVDAGSVSRAEKRSEIVGIFDAVECKEEAVLPVFLRSQKVFDSKKLTLPDDCQHALMGIGSGNPGELVARFERDADACGAAELDNTFEAVVPAFAGNTYVVKLARTGTDGLLDRMKTVQNFHI